MDPRAQNYYQNGAGRSCVNGPIDYRRIWRWPRNLNGAARRHGRRPEVLFGEYLVVG
jgi:hypothetical protein